MTLREIIAEAGGLPRLIVNGLLGAACIFAFVWIFTLGGVALGLAP